MRVADEILEDGNVHARRVLAEVALPERRAQRLAARAASVMRFERADSTPLESYAVISTLYERVGSRFASE